MPNEGADQKTEESGITIQTNTLETFKISIEKGELLRLIQEARGLRDPIPGTADVWFPCSDCSGPRALEHPNLEICWSRAYNHEVKKPIPKKTNG